MAETTTITTTKPTVVTLDSLVDGTHVLIDGNPHELLTPKRIPWGDSKRFDRYWRRILDLMQKEDNVTDAELDELDTLPDLMCRLVLLAPNEVHASLTNPQRMDILNAFMATPLRTRSEGEAMPEHLPGPSMTATPSPDSVGSTQALTP